MTTMESRIVFTFLAREAKPSCAIAWPQKLRLRTIMMYLNVFTRISELYYLIVTIADMPGMRCGCGVRVASRCTIPLFSTTGLMAVILAPDDEGSQQNNDGSSQQIGRYGGHS